eukprot:3126821-Rhodomonas_salina.2
MEYDYAFTLCGRACGGNFPSVPCMNKTLQRLHWAALQLKTVIAEAKQTAVFRAGTQAMARATELVEGQP